MNKFLIFTFFSLYLIIPNTCIASNDAFPPISVKGDQLYSGDEELILKAIGYAGIRKGKDEKDPVAEKDVGYDLVDLDMKRIKEAGFNAIRVWALLDEKIIELAEKHGLWVIGGIWTSRFIDSSDTEKIEAAKKHITLQAAKYSKHSNIAMLNICNEPEPGMLFDDEAKTLKSYFDALVATAKEHCPGIPVTFSNWPIAAFIDAGSWDIVSFNLYSQASTHFKEVIDFYDYINGLKQFKAPDKPFILSEYGMYAPLPEVNPKDIWKFSHVKSEKEQGEMLLKDLDIASETKASGFVMMQYMDIWFLSRDFPSEGIPLPPANENKNTHDPLCIEWGGLISLDEKYEGVPRKAYYAVQKANQAILREPDSRMLYTKQVPISLYIENTVAKIEVTINDKIVKTIPKVSLSWAKLSVPVESITQESEPAKHSMSLKIFDLSDNLVHTMTRSFWTGLETAYPQLEITHKLDQMEWPTFLITGKYPDGTPAANTQIDMAFLNALTWKDLKMSVTTDEKGQAVVVSPDYGPLLMGAKAVHKNGAYSKNCVQLYYYKN